MHIPDGFLSVPVSMTCAAVTCGYGIMAHKKISKKISENEHLIPLIGCTSAFIFAAQMLNFPVLVGTSGHLLGAAFSTYLFGPFITFFVMAIVLLIQCLLFADGGLLALGSNILVMGIVAPQTSFIVMKSLKFVSNSYVKIVLGSFTSVIMASALCSILLSLSGMAPLKELMLSMVGIHTLIGIGEGVITSASLVLLSQTKIINKGIMLYEYN